MNILITGANQGIGYFMVKELLRKGNSVTVLDVELEALYKLKDEFGNHILPILCDVRDGDGMRSAVEKSVSEYGGIDIAVHNAWRRNE